MPRKKKEKIEGIEDKLEYLGLELDNIPKKLKEFEPLEFRVSRFYDEKQVLDYNKIKEFQEIGFSIEDIKRFNQTNHIEKVTIINQKVDDLEEKLEKALTLKEKYDE